MPYELPDLPLIKREKNELVKLLYSYGLTPSDLSPMYQPYGAGTWSVHFAHPERREFSFELHVTEEGFTTNYVPGHSSFERMRIPRSDWDIVLSQMSNWLDIVLSESNEDDLWNSASSALTDMLGELPEDELDKPLKETEQAALLLDQFEARLIEAGMPTTDQIEAIAAEVREIKAKLKSMSRKQWIYRALAFIFNHASILDLAQDKIQDIFQFVLTKSSELVQLARDTIDRLN